MDLAIVELILLLILIFGLYKYLTRNHLFFQRQQVAFVKPKILFGNLLELFTGRENGISVFQKVYDKFSNER